jgi:lysophospholipase L1-like esterase
MLKFKNYIFIIASVILINLYGCTNTKSNKMDENEYLKATLLSLGDSYTIGESVSEAERFPSQLKNKLDSINIKIKLMDIVARTGWTTDELMNGISSSALNEKYDLVTLLIGVNNQYRGRDTANYRQEFKALLDIAINKANESSYNVIVISIPDWGVTPFAENRERDKISNEIDIFNAINYEESTMAGVKYVNITNISREAENKPELIAEDGLHPSALMYKLWVDEILPVATKILKK